jgi:protein-S-isoprenylcysteine O-methyltransferase Ste14
MRCGEDRNGMKATQFEFRFRFILILLLYLLGFWAPWTWTSDGFSPPSTTAWLALSTTLARWEWMHVEQATLLVTWLAIAFGLAGAILRVWGTAYLGSSIVHAGPMMAGQVMAGGPYRYVRNPLYLGSWFLALSIAILMPPSGAVVFLAPLGLFYFRLILGEEAFLAARIGDAYVEYRKQVPRLVPTLRPRIPASAAHPQWGTSLMAEFLPVAYPLCLAVLAWRYEPLLLIRCLVICFGISLVLRAFLPKKTAAV